MLPDMDNVTLPPDLERFAAEIVAEGRYSDVSDVVRTAVTLLQRAEAERKVFIASLHEAEAEGERDGFFTAEEVHREMSEMIESIARSRA